MFWYTFCITSLRSAIFLITKRFQKMFKNFLFFSEDVFISLYLYGPGPIPVSSNPAFYNVVKLLFYLTRIRALPGTVLGT
jgi:hypothetical protein